MAGRQPSGLQGGSGCPPTSPTFQSSGQCAGSPAQDGLNIPSELTGTKEHKTPTECARSAPSILLPDKWKSETLGHVQLNKTNTRQKPIQIRRSGTWSGDREMQGQWAGHHTQGPGEPSAQGGTKPALYPKSRGIASHGPRPAPSRLLAPLNRKPCSPPGNVETLS